MSTRRARSHKGLVAFEKRNHHRRGIHLSRRSKFRWRNAAYAVQAELAYERNKREKSKGYTHNSPKMACNRF